MRRIFQLLESCKARNVHTRFDPVYGMPWDSLEAWLAKNPSKKIEYAAELDRRSRRSRIDYRKLRYANRSRTSRNGRKSRLNGSRSMSSSNERESAATFAG